MSNEAMPSPEIQFIVATLDSIGTGDPEAAHVDADKCLLLALRKLGGTEVAEAFKRADERCGFWYA